MRRCFLFWFVMCFLWMSASGRAHEIIVKFKLNKLSIQSYHTLLNQVSTSQVYSSQLLPELKIISVKNQNIRDVIETFKHHPAVEYVEPSLPLYLFKDEDEDEEDEDNQDQFPPFPFPWPPQEGDGQFPFPWPPQEGDNKFPFPLPPKDDDGSSPPIEDPLPIDPPKSIEPKKDPKLSESWGIRKIGAAKAWKTTIGSKDIIVGIIDTGIDYNHEDLNYNVFRNIREIPNNQIDDDQNGFIDDVIGWDFVHSDKLPYDDHKHGTHVAGIIGAVGSNGIGISGVTQRTTLLAVKTFNKEGQGETTTAIKAIEYAIAQGARVLNNSWGDYEFSQALEDIIDQAQKEGIVVVCAAGNETNENDQNPSYPSGIQKENVISVAATTNLDQLAIFSNYGQKTVHLAAPGTEIYSTIPNNEYAYLDGTSMASPFVAGAAALMLSKNPKLTPLKIKELLIESVSPIHSLMGKVVSGGRLNIAKAIERVD